LLKKRGGFGAIAAILGMPEIPVIQARRGDVLQMKQQPGALGLMSLDGRAALVLGDKGIMAIRPVIALRAWHV
jgi:hypothetical protein